MTLQPPHPQRCTGKCKSYHRGIQMRHPEKTRCSVDCEIHGHLGMDELELIDRVGCASHSASSPRIEQVIKLIEEKWEHPDSYVFSTKFPLVAYRYALEQTIALLREGEP